MLLTFRKLSFSTYIFAEGSVDSPPEISIFIYGIKLERE